MRHVLLLSFVLWAMCFNVANAGIITPRVLVNGQTSGEVVGVAPFSVHFDTVGTTAQLASNRPFHDLHYHWQFGDHHDYAERNRGTWYHTGHQKSEAIGPLAAHVYDPAFTEGQVDKTFQVTLTLRDGEDTVIYRVPVSIRIQNPDIIFQGENTRCLYRPLDSSNPLPPNDTCPGNGQMHAVVTDAEMDLQMDWLNEAPRRRLLLHRGDMWMRQGSNQILGAGPKVLGAFGACEEFSQTNHRYRQGLCANAPVLHSQSGSSILRNDNGDVSDWRIMGIAFNGQQGSEKTACFRNTRWNNTLGRAPVMRDVLFYRNDFANCGLSIEVVGELVPNGIDAEGNPRFIGEAKDSPNERVFIVDNSIIEDYSAFAIFMASRAPGILGNNVSMEEFSLSYSGAGNHHMRIVDFRRGIVSENVMGGEFTRGAALKVYACDQRKGDVPRAQCSANQYAVVSDNVFLPNYQWLVNFSPQGRDHGPGRDRRLEEVQDIIVERNRFVANHHTTLLLRVVGERVTVRNNIFQGNQTSTTLYHAAYFGRYGYNNMVTSTGGRAFHNAFYHPNTTIRMFYSELPDIGFINNLAYSPNGAVRIGGDDHPSNLAINPNWLNPVGGDFRVATNSSVVDHEQSAFAPVFDDFYRNLRLQGRRDIGVHEASSTPSANLLDAPRNLRLR